jgi:hypothetical protein
MITAKFNSLPDDILRPVNTTTTSPRLLVLAMWALYGLWNAFLDGAAMYGATFCGIPRPAELRPDAAGQDEDIPA